MTKEITRSASSSSFRPPVMRPLGPPEPRRSWCGRLLSPREENQDDGAQRDNQADSSGQSGLDSDGDGDGCSRGAKPTTLEELLDLELDVHLSSTEARANAGNQPAVDDLRFADTSGDLSLELLALQSPHGRSEHWQENEDDRAFLSRDVLFEPKQVPSPIDVPALRKASSIDSSNGLSDLTSPVEHVPVFSPSPTHHASGDEYDMMSPVALPESPANSPHMSIPEVGRSGLWGLIPQLELYDDATADSTAKSPTATAKSKARAKSVTAGRQRRPRHRSSASPPRANNAYARSPPRSVLSDRKPKAKHGGIYSLLLKFKPPEQEPVLVDNLHHPDLAWPTPGSVACSLHPSHSLQPSNADDALLQPSPQSPPPSTGKPQHGGIYRMLRRAASSQR